MTYRIKDGEANKCKDCGSDALKVDKISNGSWKAFSVVCKCGRSGPCRPTEYQAIVEWNRGN